MLIVCARWCLSGRLHMLSGCCLLSTLQLQPVVGACLLMLQADAGKAPLTSLLLWAARACGPACHLRAAGACAQSCVCKNGAQQKRRCHRPLQVFPQLQSHEMASCRPFPRSLQVLLLLQWSQLLLSAACILQSTCLHQ